MANNPIKASDLYQDDGAILEAIKQWETLNKTIEEAMKKNIKLAIDLEVDIKKLNATQADHRDEIKKSATAAEKLQKEQEKYAALLDESNTKIAALKNAQITLNQVHKAEAKLAAAKEGSYNALSAQYTLNKIRLNQMSAEERRATKEGRNLEKQSKEIYEEMKRLQEVTGKHTLNVGNYADALKNLPGPLANVKAGLGAMGDAMKAIIRNPLLALVGLIAGALVGLFQAFKKSANGAELLARIGGVLEGAFSVLVKIANDLAGVLLWAFEHPKEAVIALWQTIKTQVVERMKGVIDLFGAVGRAIFNAITLNFGKMTIAAQDAGKAIETIFGDVVDYVKDVAAEVGKAADGFSDLAARTLQVARANRQLQKSVEDLITQEQVLNQIREDDTRGFEERQQAADKAADAIRKRGELEIQIARNRLSLLNQEIDLRKGQDIEGLLDEQLAAYQELKAAERDLTLSLLEEEERRRRLKQDTLERDLDILIDGFDNQKTINERLIQDENKTLAERARVYEQTVRLADDSFQKQIETIQQFTGIAVDANSLIGESDAVLLNQKIRSLGLSEIIEGRLLEIVRDRKTAIQDLAEAEAYLIEQRKALTSSLPKISSILDAKGLQSAKEDVETFARRARIAFADALNPPDRKSSIYDMLGLDVNEEGRQELKSSFDFAKDQLTNFFNLRKQLADQRVSESNQAVTAAQNELQAQIQLAELGYANRVEIAQKELATARENQRKALAEQKKAEKAQLLADTVQQTSSLITASAKVLKTVPFPLNLAAVGVMLGSFAAAKIKAFQLTKKEFAEGGLEFIGGGSHASGKDTPLGFNVAGQPAYAERGESHMVLKPGPTKKYRSVLPELFKSLNSGTFEKVFAYQSQAAGTMPVVVNSQGPSMGRTESELARIRKQGEVSRYVDGRGRTVEVRGNHKTVYL